MAEAEHHPAYVAVIAGLPVAVFKLSEGSFVLGRAPDADFRLDHLEVSRRHCRLTWDGSECHVEDLGSQWGTRVDGKPVAGRVLLKAGDVLSLGGIGLLFERGQPPPDQELERLGSGWSGATAPVPVVLRGEKAERIELGEHLTIGRDAHSDVVLNAPAVSRQHALIRRTPEGFRVLDLQSTAGSLVNGHRFDEHDLTIGDRLQIGPFSFYFDGAALEVVHGVSGGAIHASDVTSVIDGRTILDNVALDIAPSRFAGIIGPSGAGKSSLLNALSGVRPPERGVVLVNGIDATRGDQIRAFGFVPQDDIVHVELTVEQALRFAAELRLPGDTPVAEMRKLIAQTTEQLGLSDRLWTRISDLSGGQRKRVSVAVELLARPSVLFLDEPTSGLDPATEFKLMELLRDLADTGCTVVCTTHVMENVYLMDQIAI
ncbi:MAG: transport system ATP-binding/permease protein, partial [Chthoniobacter sp.]|nr:transport system ATP-binding/permease protein [Chthoniobacter sp.]